MRGRAIKGERLHDTAPFGGWQTQTFIAGLRHNEMIAPWVLNGPMNKAAECLKQTGCWFLFLPAYSPDLNPIEMAFSKLKSHLRRIGARTIEDLQNAIASILNLYESNECQNYFNAAGYGGI